VCACVSACVRVKVQTCYTRVYNWREH